MHRTSPNFTTVLTNWYSINKRDLPWRYTQDPYQIWLSEIILQQTQVKQGLPYYLKFIESFKTVYDLASADEKTVLNHWQGLGYYSRARNLHETAKHVAYELDGIFPNTYSELIKLKGIGDYTASAISSICFNKPNAVVDGNVYRVLSRYFGIEIPINSSAGQKEFKALAQKVLDKSDPATHNQAIMEFGATQCKPKNPDCDSCPFNSSCVALQYNMVGNLPVKIRKSKIRKRYFNYLVLQPKSGEIVLRQRTEKGIWQNMYQFPLIETESKASHQELMVHKEFKSLVGANEVKCYLYNNDVIIHKLSHQHLYTNFWIVEMDDNSMETISIEDLDEYPTPVLISNFVNEYSFEY